MDNVETAAYARTPAWHGKGHVCEGAMSSSDVLKLAGLDWGVEKSPVYQRRRNGEFVEIPDRYLIDRSTDEMVLGIVGGDYQTFDNREALSFLDSLVDNGELEYESAGSLGKGKRVWLMAKTPETVQFGNGEQHQPYVFVTTSHDGGSAIVAAPTMIRIECQNLLNLAIRSAKNKWSVRHTNSAAIKIQEARATLELTFKYVDAFAEEVDRMLDLAMTEDVFKGILEATFPKEQKLQFTKNVTGVMGNWLNSPTIADVRMTGWGAYNATTEWLQFERSYRSEDSRMSNVMGGTANTYADRIGGRILELAKA